MKIPLLGVIVGINLVLLLVMQLATLGASAVAAMGTTASPRGG